MSKPILYLAPLEGITIYLYRNIFHKYFGRGYVDKYFTPFLVPRGKGKTMQEQREVDTGRNCRLTLIPQILTDSPELVVSYAEPLKGMGYEEINLNFGCPSGTVTAKGRGAAILNRKDAMRRVLEAALGVDGIKVSVKTRLGMEEPEEFYELLDVYNEYPLEELIIHARVKREMYSGRPHVDMFKYTMENSRNPVVYNGDIWTVSDYRRICEECLPNGLTGIPAMLGRGAIADPWLFGKICGNDVKRADTAWKFIDEIEEAYREILSGDACLLARMKEIWTWYIRSFPGNDRNMKKLLKTGNVQEFRELEKAIIFDSL